MKQAGKIITHKNKVKNLQIPQYTLKTNNLI